MNNKILSFLDKRISFTKYTKNLEQFNLYQLFMQRFGIGKYISNSIILRTATHPSISINKYRYNVFNPYVRIAFINNELSTDITLQKNMNIELQRCLEVYNYRGSRYIEELPLHGQRRRTNANTCKVIRPIHTIHLASRIRRKMS